MRSYPTVGWCFLCNALLCLHNQKFLDRILYFFFFFFFKYQCVDLRQLFWNILQWKFSINTWPVFGKPSLPYPRSSSSYPPSLAVLKVVAIIPRANFQTREMNFEVECIFPSLCQPSQFKSHGKIASSELLLIKWKCSSNSRFYNQKNKSTGSPNSNVCLDIVIPIALQQIVILEN